MKKAAFLVSLISLMTASSCSLRNEVDYQSVTLDSASIFAHSGRVQFVPDESLAPLLLPFNTVIQAQLYLPIDTLNQEEVEKLQEDFQFKLNYYYALTDRHHAYTLDGEEINNLKVINDSYGSGEAIKVDDVLYDALKESYEFTIASEGKFNIFIGSINAMYEDKLTQVNEDEGTTALNKALSLSSNLTFSDDIVGVQNKASMLPNSANEFEGILTFDDANKAVTFNNYYKDGILVDDLSITLSGMSKGYATEVISDDIIAEYPNAALLFNSGSSSIKAIGKRPDQRDWHITYANPVYGEATNKADYNRAEVGFTYEGSFTLSTSASYENYFYVYQPDGSFQKRSHIIDSKTGLSASYFDQVSVFVDDAGLADMYTTALMNTYSVSEAISLFGKLNQKYGFTDADIILCVKEDGDSKFTYSIDDISPLSSYKLPIVTLNDGTRYEGDYADVDANYINSAVSKCQHPFKMSYYMSSSIYDKSAIIEDETIVSADKTFYAELKELADD